MTASRTNPRIRDERVPAATRPARLAIAWRSSVKPSSRVPQSRASVRPASTPRNPRPGHGCLRGAHSLCKNWIVALAPPAEHVSATQPATHRRVRSRETRPPFGGIAGDPSWDLVLPNTCLCCRPFWSGGGGWGSSRGTTSATERPRGPERHHSDSLRVPIPRATVCFHGLQVRQRKRGLGGTTPRHPSPADLAPNAGNLRRKALLHGR